MQKDSDSEYPPRRKGVIRKLAAKFLTTHRMVERVIAEHLPQIRLWAYATKGMNEIQYLQAGKIEKLKPGDYWDQKDKWLRLSVDSAGKRQWILRVIWKGTVVRDVVLGGARLSNLEARERATRARRKIESRQVRAALERAKSKS